MRSIADFGETYGNTSTGQTLIEYQCRGGSFKLMADITIDKTVYFYADTVIDLNGHTITKDFGGSLCALVQTGTITFKNGSVKIAESAIQGLTNYGDFWYQRHFYDYAQVINLNFENVTITVPEEDGFAAFKGYPRSSTGSQTVNITGAAIIGGAVEDFDNAVIQNYTNCTHNGTPYPGA